MSGAVEWTVVSLALGVLVLAVGLILTNSHAKTLEPALNFSVESDARGRSSSAPQWLSGINAEMGVWKLRQTPTVDDVRMGGA